MPPVIWVKQVIPDHHVSADVGDLHFYPDGEWQAGNRIYARGSAATHISASLIAHCPPREPGDQSDRVLTVLNTVDGETYYFQYQFAEHSGWCWYRGVPRVATPEVRFDWKGLFRALLALLVFALVVFGPLVGTRVACQLWPKLPVLYAVVASATWAAILCVPLAKRITSAINRYLTSSS
jgi:hypothetical protein